MKKVLVTIICCTAVLLASAHDISATSQVENARGTLPWIVERTSQDHAELESISAGYDYYSRTPMAIYFSPLNDRLRSATFIGTGLGSCDLNVNWNCGNLFEGAIGQFNDVANYRSADNSYFATGYVYNTSNDHLKFTRAWNITGDGSGSDSYDIADFAVDGGTIASQPSLAFDQDGNAHIVVMVDYIYTSKLTYIVEPAASDKSSKNNGTSMYWPTVEILSGSDLAEDPSITVDLGRYPRIAYYDPGNHALGYAYPADYFNNCSAAGWRCISIDQKVTAGLHPSIMFDEGRFIAYYNVSTGELMEAEFVGSGGNCGYDWTGIGYANRWQCSAIDQVGAENGSMALSLVTDGSYPVIAYQDADDTSHTILKLAQPVSRLGMPSGNCGPGSSWYCQTIDDQAEDVGQNIDLAINPSGALMIAYSQEWMTDVYRLWVARQYFQGFLPLLEK